jgi:hypothetical protein
VLKVSAATDKKRTREYDELGFSWTGDKSEPVLLCVICYETLKNDSMKPSNLKSHFYNKHKEYHDRPVEFFQNRSKDIQGLKKTMLSVTGGENVKALEASYSVSYLIAKSGAAEVIGETLIKPVVKVMAKVMVGGKESKAIASVLLPNNTVNSGITDMAENVKQ